MGDAQVKTFEKLSEDEQVGALRFTAALKKIDDKNAFKDTVAAGAPQIVSGAKAFRGKTNQKTKLWQNQLIRQIGSNAITATALIWLLGGNGDTKEKVTVEQQLRQEVSELEAEIVDLESNHADEMEAAVDAARRGLVQGSGDARFAPIRDSVVVGGNDIKIPAYTILGVDEEERREKLTMAGEFARMNLEFIAWNPDEKAMDGRVFDFSDEKLLQSDAGIEAVLKGCEIIKDNHRAYDGLRDKDGNKIYVSDVIYYFNAVKDEGKITGLKVIEDPYADGKNTIHLGTVTFSEPQ